MSRTAATFKQSDVTRVFKGAAAAGIAHDQIEVEIAPGGRIIVRPLSRAAETDKGANPWDEVLE
jgi:hypothetical protein